MANVKKLVLCGSCGNELTQEDFDNKRCPSCETILGAPTNKFFNTPDYVHYQKLDLVEKAKAEGTSSEEIEECCRKWAHECPMEDRLAALLDGQLYLSNLMHTRNILMEDIKPLIILGKRIGNLAQTLEDYVKNGGSLNEPRKVRPVPSTDELSASSTAPLD